MLNIANDFFNDYVCRLSSSPCLYVLFLSLPRFPDERRSIDLEPGLNDWLFKRVFVVDDASIPYTYNIYMLIDAINRLRFLTPLNC